MTCGDGPPDVRVKRRITFWLLLGVALALLARQSAKAQVIVTYPVRADSGVRLPAPLLAARTAAKSKKNQPRPERKAPENTIETPAMAELASSGLGPLRQMMSPIREVAEAPAPRPEIFDPGDSILIRAVETPQIVLSTFSAGGGGAVRSNTTWVNNVTQNATSITVGGTARDDNGWGATGLSINASGMDTIVINAQRNTGNATPTLFIQFEDNRVHTQVFSVSTSLFAVGSLTQVQIPIGSWDIDFGSTQITGWNIGGGGVGTMDFQMTFDNLAFTGLTAIPEPATNAVLLGLAASALVGYRRFRRDGGTAPSGDRPESK